MEPRLYERGLQWLIPTRNRAEFALTSERMGVTLRRLLAARLLGMAIEGVLVGVALWAGEDLLDPMLSGTMVSRYIGLALLVGAGVALYGLACFVTGAYRLSDLKALMRRRGTP